jgi:hypothetical protein
MLHSPLSCDLSLLIHNTKHRILLLGITTNCIIVHTCTSLILVGFFTTSLS